MRHFELAYLSTLKVCYHAIITIAIKICNYSHVSSDDDKEQIIQVTKESIKKKIAVAPRIKMKSDFQCHHWPKEKI